MHYVDFRDESKILITICLHFIRFLSEYFKQIIVFLALAWLPQRLGSGARISGRPREEFGC